MVDSMNEKIEVDMDELIFTGKANTSLITFGISTCIAFVIYASFKDGEAMSRVRGLWHWSGFDTEQEYPAQKVKEVFTSFLMELRKTFRIPNEIEVSIDNLFFIGGEKELWEDGELVLSGTENEVTHLIKVVQAFDFKEFNIKINPQKISHYHFLTSNQESVTISVDTDECTFTIDAPEEEISSEDQPYFALPRL